MKGMKRAAPIRVVAKAAPMHQTTIVREDISCGLQGCIACIMKAHDSSNVPLSPGEIAIIPDAQTVVANLRALEQPSVDNVIILASVLREVGVLSRGVQVRLRALIDAAGPVVGDAAPHPRFFLFSNDIHAGTHCAQQPQETDADYERRCVAAAFLWYNRHWSLGGAGAAAHAQTDDGSADAAAPAPATSTHRRLRLVTADPVLRAQVASMRGGSTGGGGDTLDVISLREFIEERYGAQSPLLDVVQHTAVGCSTSGSDAPARPEPHWSIDAIDAALLAGTLVKGRLRTNESTWTSGEIRGAGLGGQVPGITRVVLSGRAAINRSIHDDIVAVAVNDYLLWRGPNKRTKASEFASAEEALSKGCIPTGRVVGIIEKNRRPYCGSIESLGSEKGAGDSTVATTTSAPSSVLFQPKNSRIPRIRIHTRSLDEIRGKRLAVVIDDWPETSAFPLGHYVEVLGAIGDKDTEAKVILIDRDIPYYDFSEAVYACLPSGEWAVEPEQERCRRDLRGLCVCSVDPLGCRDIDDALHYRPLVGRSTADGVGLVEVGVHIADVSHFIVEGSPLDLEAAKRSTSVYLVDRRINMLPQLLTENLCSLVANEDRYSFSFIWTMRADNFEVVDEWFGKTIIRSHAALYYGDAQRMIDNPADASDLALGLRGLMAISRELKRKRVESGALELASMEYKFKVDNDHVNPTDMTVYKTFETNSMVEEWMLFANVAAARQCYKAFPQWAMLRRHEAPDPSAFDPLNEALQRRVGVQLDPSSSGALNRSLGQCIDPADPFFNTLVRTLTTRCLRQAQYFSSGELPFDGFAHFGLAMPIYTHFTSPIRRFADVVVHRQLCAVLGILSTSDEHTSVHRMRAIVDNINHRHEMAQKAGRDSQNLYTGFFLRNFPEGRIPLQDGFVIRDLDDCLIVMVPKYGQEGRVMKEGLTGSYGILDKVTVQVSLLAEGDVLGLKLSFQIVEAAQEIPGQATTISAVGPTAADARPDDTDEPPRKAARKEE